MDSVSVKPSGRFPFSALAPSTSISISFARTSAPD